jgi:hypothetical protein
MSTYDDIVVKRSLSPVARTDGTANGVSVDRLVSGGTGDAVLLVSTGTITDGSHAITVQESADGSTGWANVAAANIQGSLPTVVAANDDTMFEVGVRPTLRYVRAVATSTGSTTGGVFACAFILGGPRTKPISHS